MYQQGFIAATDGNVSAKLSKKYLLLTPSGVHKGFLDEDDIILTDLKGKVISGRQRPSSEIRMHVLVYSLRDNVGAIIHAHPPQAVALSLIGISLAECILPEAILSLGKIPTAPYAPPTTQATAEAIRELIKRHDAVILERHGALTVGSDLEQAFIRLESLEHTAQITAIARSIGKISPLSKEEQEKLKEVARHLGIKRECTKCGACKV
jgi:L-fuculose-phosphate aldolase